MGSGSTTTSQRAEIPTELKPLVTGSVGQELGLQQNLPISQFTSANPTPVAGLSDLQNYTLGAVPDLFQTDPAAMAAFGAYAQAPEIASQQVATPPAEQAQIEQLWNTVGGPVGSSPATQAGMQAWQANVLPTVENEMVAAGLGRSGDLLQAVGQSASQAAFPLIQQEIGNRMSSIPMLGQLAGAEQQRQLYPREQTLSTLQSGAQGLTNLSNTMFGQRQGAIQTGLQAGAVPRSVSQELNAAAGSDFSRLQALSEAATLGPTGQLLPSLIGANATQSNPLGILGPILGK